MKNFKEFCETVNELVGVKLKLQGFDGSTELMPVKKNNGVVLQGLLIYGAGEIGKTIYLDEYYQDYMGQDGGNIDDIINKIITIARDNNMPNWMADDVASRIKSFEQVKDSIVAVLVNTAANAEMLKDVPHREFEDLSIVYRIVFSPISQNEAMGTVMVKNTFLDFWGINEQQLNEIAMANTKRLLPTQIMSFNDEEMSLTELNTTVNPFTLQGGIAMFILTNKLSINGAIAMLDIELLSMAADTWKKDVFILPSSIHEVIIIGKNDTLNPANMINMVKEINAGCVDPRERLSDNVYVFDRKTKEIKMLS